MFIHNERHSLLYKAITIVLACLFILNSAPFINDAWALALTPGTENPTVRREALILRWVLSGRIRFADTIENDVLLKGLNRADVSLSDHGKILAPKELRNNLLGLTRKIIHKEVSAVLEILAHEEGSNYFDMTNTILSDREVVSRYYSLVAENREKLRGGDFFGNDILARAFELMVLKTNHLIEDREITPAESGFLKAVEPIINAHRHDYFTAIFWDDSVREMKIRFAMANGMSFTHLAEKGNGDVVYGPLPLPPSIQELARNSSTAIVGEFLEQNSSKEQIDEAVAGLNLGKKTQLMSVLISLSEKFRFNRLSIPMRYLYIRLSASSNGTSFVNAARKLFPTLIKKDQHMDFDNSVKLKGLPRVLLIGPYKAGDLKVGQFLAPPLGSYRIASFLRLFGIEADVYDPNADDQEELYKLLKNQQYDIVGFSMLQPTLHNDMNMMWRVKKILPDALIVAGGQGAAFNKDIIFPHSPASVIVRGWGEFSMLEMALAYKPAGAISRQFAHIGGLYLKDGDNCVTTGFTGHYTKDDLRTISLTQNFSMIPYEKYWEHMRGVYSDEHLKIMRNKKFLYTIRLYTQSHCPMGCDFCSSTHLLDDAAGKRQVVQTLSAEDIIAIIENARNAHPEVKAFYFNDDNFTFSRSRVNKLCDLLTARFPPGELVFFCLSRADNVERELLAKMKKAGFEMIVYGIESFSDKILKDMGKKVRTTEGLSQSNVNENAVRWTLESGMVARLNFILFYPTVTLEEIRKTIDKAVDFALTGAIFDPFTFVETYAGAHILNEGYSIKSKTHDIAGRSVSIPETIELEDSNMRDIANRALALKPAIDEEIREVYKWHGTLPGPVNTLSLFKSIYTAAGLSTAKIDQAIFKLLYGYGLPLHRADADITSSGFFSHEKVVSKPAPIPVAVQHIEITPPSNPLPEETLFTESIKSLEETSWLEYGNYAADTTNQVAYFDKSGQSVILYADDILENGLVIDFENTMKNILGRYGILDGGKIILYARNETNAIILEKMIKHASPNLKTIKIMQRDLQTNGDEIKEIGAVLNLARAKGVKEVLGLIKGPTKQPERLAAFAKMSNIPIVIFGYEKGIYSFAQAITMAIATKMGNGSSNNWLIMLSPVRALTEDMRRQYEEYQRSLQAMVAA